MNTHRHGRGQGENVLTVRLCLALPSCMHAAILDRLKGASTARGGYLPGVNMPDANCWCKQLEDLAAAADNSAYGKLSVIDQAQASSLTW